MNETKELKNLNLTEMKNFSAEYFKSYEFKLDFFIIHTKANKYDMVYFDGVDKWIINRANYGGLMDLIAMGKDVYSVYIVRFLKGGMRIDKIECIETLYLTDNDDEADGHLIRCTECTVYAPVNCDYKVSSNGRVRVVHDFRRKKKS